MNKLFFILFLFLLGCDNYLDTPLEQAKLNLRQKVYIEDNIRRTIYCNISYDEYGKFRLPVDFPVSNRPKRIEWEHIVPSSKLGQNYTEWTQGHPLCVNERGKAYKGRKCARNANKEFELMEADMYNLYPSISYVNEARSNYEFSLLPNSEYYFSDCRVKISKGKIEPPAYSRGQVARAYLYMDSTYDRYSMSERERKLMTLWSTKYPVTKNECLRTKRIESIQSNENKVVKDLCIASDLW